MAVKDVNELADAIIKILSIKSAVEESQKESTEEKERTLTLIIEEQHRDYDYLVHIYNRIRATESVLLTASFGLVAYLYFTPDVSQRLTVAQRFAIPDNDAGKVIYFIAAAFFTYGIVKLMLTVFGNNDWVTAYETPKEKYSENYVENLEYIKNRYDKCYEINGSAYMKRRVQLTILFFCIVVSAIILIALKTIK